MVKLILITIIPMILGVIFYNILKYFINKSEKTSKLAIGTYSFIFGTFVGAIIAIVIYSVN